MWVPSEWIHNSSPHLSLREHRGRGGRKVVKSQKIRGFALRMCLLIISEANTHKFSPMLLPKHELSKENNRHANGEGKKPKRLQPYTKG